MKMRDLQRDPRCVLHSTTSSKDREQGDVNLYARAVNLDDGPYRYAYLQALRAATGWAPAGPFHLFGLDVRAASFVQFADPALPSYERLRGDASVSVRLKGGDAISSRYVVVTWPAAGRRLTP
ncbi:MAG: hypothetical protein FJZ92_09665 [Chloroflexi bacterium]|nr:hypothetical protein [Chloroflexota bacterium]